MLPLLFGAYGCDPLLGPGSIAGGHPVVGAGLEAGGEDAVLPVTHLQLEVVEAALQDGIGVVVEG
jgi:hypothetical protein